MILDARALRRLTILLGALALGCGGGKDDCLALSPGCETPSESFELVLETAPLDIGAILVQVNATESKSVSALGGRRLYQENAAGGPGSVRAIVMGATPGQPFARVTFDTPQSVAPTVTVVSAARNASGAYSLLTGGEVIVSVRPTTR